MKLTELEVKIAKEQILESRQSGNMYANTARMLNKLLDEALTIHSVGWQSEQLPEFDVQEINNIINDAKKNKETLQTLIGMIWNKGYMTGICYDIEND
jgi:methionine salvage enolase-phosphatase E1